MCRKAIVGLVALVMGGSAAAGAEQGEAIALHAPQTRQLVAVFAARGGTPPPPLAAADAIPAISKIEEGSVLTLAELLSGGGAERPVRQPLLADAGLALLVGGGDGAPLTAVPLARCAALDLYEDVAADLSPRATCDGRIFDLSVASGGFEVRSAGETVQRFVLAPGLYSLNGFPFRVR